MSIENRMIEMLSKGKYKIDQKNIESNDRLREAQLLEEEKRETVANQMIERLSKAKYRLDQRNVEQEIKLEEVLAKQKLNEYTKLLKFNSAVEQQQRKLAEKLAKQKLNEYTKLLKFNSAVEQQQRKLEEKLAKEKDRDLKKRAASYVKHMKAQYMHEEKLKRKEQSDYIKNLKFNSAVMEYQRREKLRKQKKEESRSSHPSNKIGGVFERMTGRFENKGIMHKLFSNATRMPKASKIFKESFTENYRNTGSIFKSILPALKEGMKVVGALRFAFIGLAGAVTFTAAAITGGLIVFAILIKKLLEMNQQIADFSKEAGTSVDQMTKMYASAQKLSNQLDSFAMTAAKVMKIQIDYQKELGGVLIDVAKNSKYSKLISDISLLTTNLGLSVQNASKLNLISIAMRSNLAEMTTDIGGVTTGLEKNTKAAFDMRGIFKEVSEVPLGIAAGFKGSTKEMILLIQRAKMLGMNLKQINNIGEGLIDIENSLQAEMEARIIYGKNINLDAARYYQMIGRTDLMFDEILKQAGGLVTYQNKLPLQQQAFAKALGMSTDELTEILTRQQNIRDLGFDLYDSQLSIQDLKDKLKQNYTDEEKMLIRQQLRYRQSLSVMEALSAAWEKIQDVIFGPLIEPFNKVLNDLVLALDQGANGPFAKAIQAFQDFFIQNGDSLIKQLASLMEHLPKFLTSALTFMEKLFKGEEDLFGSIGRAIGKGIREGIIGGIGGAIIDAIIPKTIRQNRERFSIEKEEYHKLNKPWYEPLTEQEKKDLESKVDNRMESKYPGYKQDKLKKQGESKRLIRESLSSIGGAVKSGISSFAYDPMDRRLGIDIESQLNSMDNATKQKTTNTIPSTNTTSNPSGNNTYSNESADLSYIEKLINNSLQPITINIDGERFAEKMSDSMYRYDKSTKITGLQRGF